MIERHWLNQILYFVLFKVLLTLFLYVFLFYMSMMYTCTLTHKVHCIGIVYTLCSAPSSGRTVELQYSVIEIFEAFYFLLVSFSFLDIYFSSLFFLISSCCLHTQTRETWCRWAPPTAYCGLGLLFECISCLILLLCSDQEFLGPSNGSRTLDSWTASEPTVGKQP